VGLNLTRANRYLTMAFLCAKHKREKTMKNDLAEVTTTVKTMTSREVAELTGKEHKNVLRDIDVLLESLSSELSAGFKSTTYKDSTGKSNRMFEMDHDSSVCLVTGYDVNSRMKVIKRWQELESKQPKPEAKSLPDLDNLIAGANAIAKMFNYSESAKVTGLKRVLANVQPELITMLPDYTVDKSSVTIADSSDVTKSLSALLKEFDVPLSALKANLKLLELGFLEHNSRKNSKGEDVKFYSVTEKGLKYGKNLISDKNPRETQPHWFVSSFQKLANILTNKI